MSERLERRYQDVQERIKRVESELGDGSAFDDSPAIAGASGQSARRIAARGCVRDRIIDQSVQLRELYGERDDLQARMKAERMRPLREEARRIHAERIEQAIRAAGVGCRVMTRYGEVTVMRINRKTARIRTDSGYTEAMLFEEIAKVLEWS